MARRSVLARIGALTAIAAAVIAMSTTVAVAGPSEATLDVASLQSAINTAGGSLDGYLKTVDKGSDIIHIPVHVLAVTAGFGDGSADMSSLIYFKAYGSEIDEIGGIAAGMSGSPIYVEVDGEEKLIGALSYGDVFTTDGAGLATPIGAMAAMQGTYAPSSMPRNLATPTVVDSQTKTRVEIVSAGDEPTSAPADTIVARPLSSAFIGGISPSSRMYKAYAAHLAKLGVDVVPLQGGLSSTESTYNAPFQAGSAVAALASRGDMWVGGMGTTTYVDGNDVVAFGHPAFWEGDTDLYLTNAWVDGVWPSTYEAYKLWRPAAVRGSLVQDRLEGIVGVDGSHTAETTITARAYNEETGKVATSAVYMPRHVTDSSDYDFDGLAAAGASVAGSRVFNAYTIPGSADTTTTIVVSDGTKTYTIVRTNHVSDPYDITIAAIDDVNSAVTDFEEANADGISTADILSVDLDATYHKARNEGEVVAVTVPGGIKSGENTASVSLLVYGDTATHTVDVTFTVPPGVPVTGSLIAKSVNNPYGDYLSDSYGEDITDESDGPTTDRRTTADVVDQLNSEVDNTVISVSFQPEVAESDSDSESDSSSSIPDDYEAIESTTTTPWVTRSRIEMDAPQIFVYPNKKTYAYGSRSTIDGVIVDLYSIGRVSVTASGIPTQTIKTDGEFTYKSPALTHTTQLHFAFLGASDALPTSLDVTLGVSAKTTIKASKSTVTAGKSVSISTEVLPHDAGGDVALQRWNGYAWSTVRTTALPNTGKVSWTYKTSKAGAVRLRSRYLGSTAALANSSSSVSIKVK